MRDYAKVAPQFWTGRTGKALKVAGPESVIVAMYLMTSPHANMIGLYHCPVAYIAIDTGLSLEGASKGLASCIEADFCQYDDAIEYVFVVEFAKYQLGDELDPKDKRCQGVANELAKVPKCLLHNSFRAHYAVPYHLPLPKPHASPLKAPPKPRAGARAGTGDTPHTPNGGFDEFYAAYPRKVKPVDARKAWDKLKPDAELLARMLRAIAEQKKSPQWLKDGGQFIPYPATWLNAGEWDNQTAVDTTTPAVETWKPPPALTAEEQAAADEVRRRLMPALKRVSA